jgi:isopentenyldiphosphate isomerase
MAKVLDNMDGLKGNPIALSEKSRMHNDDLIDLKLHAAQEILAEVFGITVAEAEEMIKQRSKERILWPEKFETDR